MVDCLVHLDVLYCLGGELLLKRVDTDAALTIMYYSSLPLDWWGVDGELAPHEVGAALSGGINA